MDAEEFQFFDFAKQHIKLVLTVTSIPLISGALGVLPPPNGESRLNVLSSLICLIMFSGCWLLRGLLRSCVYAEGKLGRVLHAVPFVASGVVLAAAIVATAIYADARTLFEGAQKAGVESGKPPAAAAAPRGEDVAKADASTKADAPALYIPGLSTNIYPTTLYGVSLYYLSLYPLYVLGLGLVLVTSFAQFTANSVQHTIDAKLTDEKENIAKVVGDYARFKELCKKDGESLKKVGDKLLQRAFELLGFLSRGELEVAGPQAAEIQGVLMAQYPKQFDAVCDRDVKYWARRDQGAQDYFDRNEEAILRGTTVTRIFVINDRDLDPDLDVSPRDGDKKAVSPRSELAKVLKEQHELGVGFGLAIYEELGASVRDETKVALDFGIFHGDGDDDDAAVSFFRDYREERRKYRVVFGAGDQGHEVQKHRQRFQDIMTRCWLVNTKFCEAHKARIEKEENKAAISRTRERVDKRLGDWQPARGRQLHPNGPFYFEIEGAKEIDETLAFIWDIRKAIRAQPEITHPDRTEHVHAEAENSTTEKPAHRPKQKG
jgi:hypothetical protein